MSNNKPVNDQKDYTMTKTIKFIDASNIEVEPKTAIMVNFTNALLINLLDELVEKFDVQPDGPDVAHIQNVITSAFAHGSLLSKLNGVVVQEVDAADDFPFEDNDEVARICRMEVSK